MAEVSIIVPIYNAEKRLSTCIESILAQSYSDFELILINDGSIDQSGEICRSYVKQDNRVILTEQANAGVSAARNKGIEIATGNYILFVDSDDFLPMDYVENMIAAQKELGEEYFVISAIKITSPNDAVPEQILTCGMEDKVFLNKKEIMQIFRSYLLNSPCNKLFFRKDILNNKLHMFDGMSIAEDLLFNIQYWKKAEFKKVIVLNENQYLYIRTGEESLDNKFNSDYYENHAMAYAELLDCCKELAVEEKDVEILLRRYFSIIERSLNHTLHPDCKLKWWQKWHKNDIILKDALFGQALQKEKSSLSRGRYLAYRSKSYGLVWMYNHWSAFRNRNKHV